MSDVRPDPRGLSRRSLARVISGATAAALLPGRSRAEDTPTPSPRPSPESHADALVEAALSVTPAALSAEQRLDVRRGVRDLQKALAEARRVSVPYETDPATVFLPEGHR